MLSIVFFYLFVIWFALQPYLFPLLVEFNQPIRRVWRNAFFMVTSPSAPSSISAP